MTIGGQVLCPDSGLRLPPRPYAEIGFEQITTHRFLIRGGDMEGKPGGNLKKGDEGSRSCDI